MPPGPAIHVRHLRVRVPGTAAATGEALAEGLRAKLGALPAPRALHFGALNLRVTAPDPAHGHTLPATIVSALSRHLAQPPAANHA